MPRYSDRARRWNNPEPPQFARLDSLTLARAVDRLMIGANSIASALIGVVGPTDFTTWDSYETAQREIRARMGADWYEVYEMWVMWHCAMSVRDELEEKLKESTG